MNETTKAIILRLRKIAIDDLVSPQDIAGAYGMNSPNAIVRDIRTGRLPANRIHNRTFISIAAAERYIAENEYTSDEA